ncbi:hypothetical protein TWF281_011242 [Arthrobotrys megalospora]
MRAPLHIALLFSSFAAIVSASPISQPLIISEEQDELEYASPLEERDLPSVVCSKIKGLVSLLKAQNATPFCSSWLQIPTQTIFTTNVIPTTTTQVDNTIVFTTVTIIAQTNTATLSETRTLATLPTVVQTSVVPSVSIFVSTVTPARVTETTTVWTTPVVKREVEERGVPLPPWIRGFATPAISSACSCLDIPKSSVTQTVTEYASNTVLTTSTIVSTDTALSTAQTSVTLTFYTTLYVPTTTFSTAVTVPTTVTTLATPTTTSTIFRPLPTACFNILSGNKLVTQAGPGRNIGPSPDQSVQRFFAVRTEFTLSQCCAHAYEVPNCGVWFFSDRGAAAGAQRYACRPWTNTDQLGNNISPICPRGTVGDGQSNVSFQGQTGFGIGPCYGKYVVI